MTTTKLSRGSRAGPRTALLAAAAAASALSSVFLGGCDRLGLSADDAIAKLPDNFQETAGSARIMPDPASVKVSGRRADGKYGVLEFFRRTTAGEPYCGAAMRLIPEKAEAREEYKKFLLPRTILRYESPHPAAVTVEFGGVAQDIRCVVPAGGHYIGLLPKFDQKWLTDIGTGGAAAQAIKAIAVWSRMGSEDLLCGSSVFVSSIHHYPKADFFPLFVSAVDPGNSSLPGVGNGGGGGVGGWVGQLLVQRVFPRVPDPKFLPGTSGSGWVMMRPFSEIRRLNDVSEAEAGVMLASMALRDGVPCWFAVFSGKLFLMLGGDPREGGSYAFSVGRYLSRAGQGGAYDFLDDSRRDYLSSLTEDGDPKFLSADDHRLFYPVPSTKPKPSPGKTGTAEKPSNPFAQPITP